MQRTMNDATKTRTHRVALCGMLLALIFLTSTNAYASNPRTVTTQLGHEEHPALVIHVENCTVFIEPSDEEKAECTYDSGALRISQGDNGETYQLNIQSLSGQRMGFEAAATIYVPHDTFEHVVIETNNSDVMISHSIDSDHVIHAVDSRIDIQHTNGSRNQCAIQLTRSMCTFAIDEEATDYAVEVRMSGGLLSVPVGGMPEPTKGGTYSYTSGVGASNIFVENLAGSNMSFVFARRAN